MLKAKAQQGELFTSITMENQLYTLDTLNIFIMTDPIKDLFDRHSFDPEQVTLSLGRHMTLDQFRAALTEYAPKRPSDEEIEEIADMEASKLGTYRSYTYELQLKSFRDRIFGPDKKEGE
jgi:hypothetical protein